MTPSDQTYSDYLRAYTAAVLGLPLHEQPETPEGHAAAALGAREGKEPRPERPVSREHLGESLESLGFGETGVMLAMRDRVTFEAIAKPLADERDEARLALEFWRGWAAQGKTTFGLQDQDLRNKIDEELRLAQAQRASASQTLQTLRGRLHEALELSMDNSSDRDIFARLQALREQRDRLSGDLLRALAQRGNWGADADKWQQRAVTAEQERDSARAIAEGSQRQLEEFKALASEMLQAAREVQALLPKGYTAELVSPDAAGPWTWVSPGGRDQAVGRCHTALATLAGAWEHYSSTKLDRPASEPRTWTERDGEYLITRTWRPGVERITLTIGTIDGSDLPPEKVLLQAVSTQPDHGGQVPVEGQQEAHGDGTPTPNPPPSIHSPTPGGTGGPAAEHIHARSGSPKP